MSSQADHRQELGQRGERLAERFLRRAGLKTIVRHFGTPVGELDLVMREGEALVFVEVKTRQDRTYADPQDAVGREKQRRLARAARWFIHHRRWEERPCRFDVVAVTLRPGQPPQIEHLRDAFLPT